MSNTSTLISNSYYTIGIYLYLAFASIAFLTLFALSIYYICSRATRKLESGQKQIKALEKHDKEILRQSYSIPPVVNVLDILKSCLFTPDGKELDANSLNAVITNIDTELLKDIISKEFQVLLSQNFRNLVLQRLCLDNLSSDNYYLKTAKSIEDYGPGKYSSNSLSQSFLSEDHKSPYKENEIIEIYKDGTQKKWFVSDEFAKIHSALEHELKDKNPDVKISLNALCVKLSRLFGQYYYKLESSLINQTAEDVSTKVSKVSSSDLESSLHK